MLSQAMLLWVAGIVSILSLNLKILWPKAFSLKKIMELKSVLGLWTLRPDLSDIVGNAMES